MSSLLKGTFGLCAAVITATGFAQTTAILAGKNGKVGIGLVEIYNVQ